MICSWISLLISTWGESAWWFYRAALHVVRYSLKACFLDMVLRWWVCPLSLPYKQVVPLLICVAQWRKCFGWKSFEKFLCSPWKVSGEFPWTQNTTVSFWFGTKGAQDLYFRCILGSLFCGACSFKPEHFVNLWSGGVWIMLYKKIVCQCIWVICYIHACKGYVGRMRGCVDWRWCDALH